jgi:hypothetical protein
MQINCRRALSAGTRLLLLLHCASSIFIGGLFICLSLAEVA